jgi:D-alanyl-D-alanine carboxypeptidase
MKRRKKSAMQRRDAFGGEGKVRRHAHARSAHLRALARHIYARALGTFARAGHIYARTLGTFSLESSALFSCAAAAASLGVVRVAQRRASASSAAASVRCDTTDERDGNLFALGRPTNEALPEPEKVVIEADGDDDEHKIHDAHEDPQLCWREAAGREF